MYQQDDDKVPKQINHNFSESIVIADSLLQSGRDNQELVLEQTIQQRKTTLFFLTDGECIADSGNGVEILVLKGSCVFQNKTYSDGHYLRLPEAVTLTGGKNGCTMFVKYNQFMSGDRGERIIDTGEKSKWLPGPVEGIKIRPLHVFNTESIMLLHWQKAAEFRPNLDPQGEELLVISGLLQNKDHLFKPYSWLRNPIEDWRSWHGSSNTLVYYKSGHFPTQTH